MDPRYQWPQQGYPNTQYGAPVPPPNGYQTNGYPVQYPQQPMPPAYPQSHPISNHPRVVIPPPRPSQQYHPAQNGPQILRRSTQPQVVIAPRDPGPIPQMQAPRIRQVQVPVQRSNSDGARSSMAQRQPQQLQTPPSKPVQSSQSFQENPPRPQQRTPSLPTSNQPRTPLQPQSTPKQRAHSQQQSSQHRSPSLSQPSSQARSHPQVVIKKPAPQLQTPTRPQPPAPTQALPADLTVLLLSAADEYINAAHGLGSIAAIAQREEDLARYYKLMATGLGCMEAVLRKYKQAPRDEAKLRLRYASLLIDETDNNMEIEDVLTKGIALCQRNRLVDLKYSMQHLQARHQFKSNHRAALKSLDQPISETETFQHIVWVYAFRFLKVSLALQVPGRPETASALQQLHAIANQAERRGDRAIYVTASALEAMIHLRTPSQDHLVHAQRAIAAARSLQLQTSTQQLGQIGALIDSIDIACSLQQGKADFEKMNALQRKMDGEPASEDGMFSVLIEKSFGGNLTLFTGNVFRKAKDGRDELTFSWLPKNDLKLLTYYLSGLTSLPHERGVLYLQEGFKQTQDVLLRQASFGMSIPAAVSQRNWMATLDWQLQYALGLSACHQEDRNGTAKALSALRKRLTQPPFNNMEPYSRFYSYLSGVHDQSKGLLDKALSTYALPAFELPTTGSTSTDFKTDVAILATMNRILILRSPAHPEHYLLGVLFSQLEPLCTAHPNQAIDVAFRIIRALTKSDDSINRQKTLIHNALNTSQKLKNFQFITVCLNYMTSRFFADSIGEQAIKGVRAARQVAKQSGSVLWRAVSYGLCINTFQRNGLLQDAAVCQQYFEELIGRLPPPLQGGYVEGDDDVKMGE